MSKKQYDCAVFIGRFQPFHNGHLSVVKQAKKLANKVLIIIGSSQESGTIKNPFSQHDRSMTIVDSLRANSNDGNRAVIFIDSNYDTPDDNQAWVSRIQHLVYKVVSPDSKIVIIGHNKDETSFYLDLFPNWDLEEVELNEDIHSTTIRNLYLTDSKNMSIIQNMVPAPCYEFLKQYRKTAGFMWLKFKFIVKKIYEYYQRMYE